MGSEEDRQRLSRAAHGIREPLSIVLGLVDLLADPALDVDGRQKIAEAIKRHSEAAIAGIDALIAPAPQPPALRQGRVLLADDSHDNQVLISRMIRRPGLHIDTVENGRLAVDRALEAIAAGEPYDAILMDMQMPVLDGYAATTELRARGYAGFIIAVTAHAMVGERDRCLAIGCDAYVSKPVDRIALVGLLTSVLARATPEPTPEPTNDIALVSTLSGDDYMAGLVASFVVRLREHALTMTHAFSAGDLAGVHRIAHQLRGAAAGYGFATIGDAAGRLEDAIKAKAEGATIETELEVLLALCARAEDRRGDKTLSILAIDDSDEMLTLIAARLRPEGIAVHRAGSSLEGLAVAREHKPELVLLDLELRGENGLEICRRLKADPLTATLPVIILTSTADAGTKAAALELGAVDYVTKPFDAVELRARVRAALRAKRFQDQLASRAQIDGLTGLWNRAYFDSRLEAEVSSSLRYGRPLTLGLVDADHFKRLNDNYGHPFGDEVLRRIAATLGALVRSGDVVCRYGGEELAILFRETALEGAKTVAERLCAAISSIVFESRSGGVHVTVSIGLASLEDTPGEEHLPGRTKSLGAPERTQALVAAADEALYRAKREGRDRVCT